MRPERTEDVRRGARRRLAAEGFEAIREFTPTRGARVDLFGVGRDGEIWIVEVKSCWEDFAVDGKWGGYRAWCDRLFFAVDADFPAGRLPEEVGLICADRFDAAILRLPEMHKLAPARRRALLLKATRHAAARLRTLEDPGLAGLGSLAEDE